MRRRRRPIRRRMPRKNTYSYLRPFIALLLLVSVGYYVFGFFWGADNSNGTNGDESQVTLFVEKGSAKILLWGEENWDNAPDGVKLFQGDTVKTDIDSRVRMAFFDQSIVRLDERSRVSIESVDTSEDAEKAFQLDFEEGEIWAKIEKSSSEGGVVDLFADGYKLSSNGGTFSLTEDTIRCISGRAEIEIFNTEEGGVVLKTTSIGVGQEIVLTQEVIDELKTNSQAEVLSAISDNFEQSEWYEWNQFKDGNSSTFVENQEDEIGDETEEDNEDQEQGPITFSKPFSGAALIAETVKVSGSINEETVVALYINEQKANIENGVFSASLELKEGTNSFKVFIEDKEGIREQLDNYVLIRDTEKPQTPKITVPSLGSNNRIEITSDVQEISGTVPSNTEKVIVSFYDNGNYSPYALGKYEPGSTSFTYYARTSIGNLKSGENRYRVYTEDQAGNQSQPIEFTIIYTPQEEEAVEEVIEDTPSRPDENDNASTGTISINPAGLSVTQPAKKDGRIVVNQAPIYLKGKTFSQTKRITINGKIVSTFTPGNSTWAYKLDLSLGNLREGSNNLTIKAYDEDGSELGSITEVVEYVVEKISAPIINRPTTDDVFEAENKRITIGGRCSSRSTKIYVNGEIISYKKGETDWSTEVELVPGDNNFSVYAEDSSGNKSSATRVTVIYSPEVTN